MSTLVVKEQTKWVKDIEKFAERYELKGYDEVDDWKVHKGKTATEGWKEGWKRGMLGEAKHHTCHVLGITLRTFPGRMFLYGLNGVLNVSEQVLDMVSYEGTKPDENHASAQQTLLKHNIHVTNAGDASKDNTNVPKISDIVEAGDQLNGGGDGPTKDMATQSAPSTKDQGIQSSVTPMKSKPTMVKRFVYTCVVVKPLEIWLFVLRRLNKVLGDMASQESKQSMEGPKESCCWKKTMVEQGTEPGLIKKMMQSILTTLRLRRSQDHIAEGNMYLYVMPDRKDISPNKALHTKRKFVEDMDDDISSDEESGNDAVEDIGATGAEDTAANPDKLLNGVSGIHEFGHEEDGSTDPTGTEAVVEHAPDLMGTEGAVHATCPADMPQNPNDNSIISSDGDNYDYEVNGHNESCSYPSNGHDDTLPHCANESLEAQEIPN